MSLSPKFHRDSVREATSEMKEKYAQEWEQISKKQSVSTFEHNPPLSKMRSSDCFRELRSKRSKSQGRNKDSLSKTPSPLKTVTT